MKTLINYLFPNDWIDIKVIEVNSYSYLSGNLEGLSRYLVIQKSPSTGRYRKQNLNLIH